MMAPLILRSDSQIARFIFSTVSCFDLRELNGAEDLVRFRFDFESVTGFVVVFFATVFLADGCACFLPKRLELLTNGIRRVLGSCEMSGAVLLRPEPRGIDPRTEPCG